MIWVWKLKRIPVFFLMTCNRSSHGCHLSTSVLFLVRPARGAGAQLHHSTWARETGSSRVQRPTWSMSSHPATATTGDPISEGLQLLRCDNSLQFHRYSTWSFQKEKKDSAVNFSSVFVTNVKNTIFNSFPLKITYYILHVLFHNSDKESGSLVIEQECRMIPSLDKS